MEAILTRYDHGAKQTLGRLDTGTMVLHTLELPWKDNQRRVSCIPEGVYFVEPHTSPKFGKSFWVKDVPRRSSVLIHPGNYFTDILGCILPGLGLSDINGDGLRDVTGSKKAMKKLLAFAPHGFKLTITRAGG